MKRTGYILLQVSAYLILLGGIIDFAMTFYRSTLPASHLEYLKIKNEEVSPALRNLNNAFLRAIGGCLVAIGIGSLTIIYTSLRRNARSTLNGLVGMVTVAEGINASQMFLVNSPYFVFPLLCVVITWIGAALWLTRS